MVGCPNLEDEQQKDGNSGGEGEDDRFNFHWFHVFTLLRV